jgi:hypothetical protein
VPPQAAAAEMGLARCHYPLGAKEKATV